MKKLIIYFIIFVGIGTISKSEGNISLVDVWENPIH